MSSNVKNRIQELNNRLADTLVEKGLDANGQETTTELIEKVGQFQPGEIPEGYVKPEGTLDIVENGTFDVREKAEVNVQVVAKPEKPYIDSSKMMNFTEFCAKNCNIGIDVSAIDTSSGTNFTNMFYNRDDLEEIPSEITLNTSNGTIFTSMFNGCVNLKTSPNIDTSNATELSNLYAQCKKLQEIPPLNTGKCERFLNTFLNCSLITTIPPIDTSKGSAFYYIFGGCSKLETLPELDFGANRSDMNGIFYVCRALKNVTFKSIKVSNDNFSVRDCPLTVESLLSLLNALIDNTGNATRTITLGSANLAKLTDEQLEIAYNKNILLK